MGKKRAWFQAALAVLLLLALAGGLTACGREAADGSSGAVDSALAETVFVPERVSLPSGLSSIADGCLIGETLYLITAEIKTVEAEYSGYQFPENRVISRIFRAALGGNDAEELAAFQPSRLPEGAAGSVSISFLSTVEDGSFWIKESIQYYYFDLPEDFDPELDDRWEYRSDMETLTLCRQLDAEGNELRLVDMNALAEQLGVDLDAVYTFEAAFDRDGRAFVVTPEALYVLDRGQKLLFTLKGQSMSRAPILLADGSMALSCYSNEPGRSGYQLRRVDLEAGAWGEAVELPANTYELYGGGGEFLFFYNSGDGLYGHETQTGADRKLFSWFDTDLNQNGVRFLQLKSDGKLVLMARDWERDSSGSANMILARLTETDRAELPEAEKTVLTFATLYLDYETEKLIQRFNRGSEHYAIQVRDYSELSGGDWNAARTRLTTELITGNIPDILDPTSMPLRQLGAKGFLEDLWPWIENDPELGREAVMERVLDAASQDGKLYTVFSQFHIRTVVGAASVVGERVGWTMEDMFAAWKTIPEDSSIFYPGTTKAAMLSTLMSVNADRLVNWTTGECFFDSEEFRTILAFCDTFPAVYDESVFGGQYQDTASRLVAGQQMLAETTLNDFTDIQLYEATFGGRVSYVGYPTLDGSCGSSFEMPSLSPVLAMSASCKDKEGAWSFIRQVLLPKYAGMDFQETPSSTSFFTVNKADFAWTVEKAMTPWYATDRNGRIKLDSNGDPIVEAKGSMGNGAIEVEIWETTQEQVDQIMALYNSIDRMNTYDETIYEIVLTQAEAYFSGDRSLEEVVRLIQGRVNLYINENR